MGYTRNLPEDNSSYITQVVTQTAYRGQGVFTRLIKKYIQVCKEKKISKIWLTTGENNKKAREAYEKAGFQIETYFTSERIKYVYQLEEKALGTSVPKLDSQERI